MNIVKTDILDLYIIEPKVFGDGRGWFVETGQVISFRRQALKITVQDNHSFSASKGVLRGLHFQKRRQPRQSLFAVAGSCP